MLEADLDPSVPSPHTLLNIKMVVWQDGQGKWGAGEDKCPHRYRAKIDSLGGAMSPLLWIVVAMY